MPAAAPQPVLPPPARLAAAELQRALEAHGLTTDLHEGYGLALVSVGDCLIVWCDQDAYWWRTGWDPHRRRALYIWHPATDPVRAAHRIALQCTDLRARHLSFEPIIGESPCR